MINIIGSGNPGRIKALCTLLAGLALCRPVSAFDIGLVPLHEFSRQAGQHYGHNISLRGTPRQIDKMRRWLAQIAAVPQGLRTLVEIGRSGHKLMLFHSHAAMISSGKTSAPLSSNLINGRGESVDIYFNFDIPDRGSHRVLDNHGNPIEYTAAQNLYHELAHAMHMMNGTWRYAGSESQAIDEENVFRRQLALMGRRTVAERVSISGEPICPETGMRIDPSWGQDVICF